MGSVVIKILMISVLLGSTLVTSDPDSNKTTFGQMDEKMLRNESSNFLDKINRKYTDKYSFNNTDIPSTYHVHENNNININNYFNSNINLKFNKSVEMDVNPNDNVNKISKVDIEVGRHENDGHSREVRSESDYDYDQNRINYKVDVDENKDIKSNIKDYKSENGEIQIRHKGDEGVLKNFRFQNGGLEIMSHLYVNDNSSGGAMNKLEGENLIMAKNNETLKSLGSIDVVVPSLEGMKLPAGRHYGDHNFSRIVNGSWVSTRTNRTNYQMLGRTDAPMLNYIFDTYSNKHHHRNDRFGGPKIETPGSSVTVDTEEDAILDCKVTSLQDKLVSWLRRRPDHETPEILTIGQQAYTADIRISVDFLVPNTWRLILRKAVPTDSGTYECQLSTHPPMISRHELTVHAPVIEILDADGDKYYERNSTLELACRVRHISTTAVNWFHQTRNLNDDTIRGGINVKTEAVSSGADSLLQVARLTASDGGKYTCSIRDGLQASINVHVLNESLAELQQTAGSSRTTLHHHVLLLSAFVVVFMFVQQFSEEESIDDAIDVTIIGRLLSLVTSNYISISLFLTIELLIIVSLVCIHGNDVEVLSMR